MCTTSMTKFMYTKQDPKCSEDLCRKGRVARDAGELVVVLDLAVVVAASCRRLDEAGEGGRRRAEEASGPVAVDTHRNHRPCGDCTSMFLWMLLKL